MTNKKYCKLMELFSQLSGAKPRSVGEMWDKTHRDCQLRPALQQRLGVERDERSLIPVLA